VIDAREIYLIQLGKPSKTYWRDEKTNAGEKRKKCKTCGHAVFKPCPPNLSDDEFPMPCAIPALKNN
jgi:hypothetical protein